MLWIFKHYAFQVGQLIVFRVPGYPVDLVLLSLNIYLHTGRFVSTYSMFISVVQMSLSVIKSFTTRVFSFL